MTLTSLQILNYRNLENVELQFSPNVNCFIGRNGMGKTNILDAIYYLSFCKSSSGTLDALCIRHDTDFFMIQGKYLQSTGSEDMISCGVKRGQRKRVRRNDKEYRRLAEHIGVVPLVLISPSDSQLITGGSDERRRFLDVVISQYDTIYLESLMRYNKMLQQRNALLKQQLEPDPGVLDVLETMMGEDAAVIYQARRQFVEAFRPTFQAMYGRLCDNTVEVVDIHYQSHAERGELTPILRVGRAKERIVGYTLHGPHKDDIELTINGYPIRREGSQGQNKTFFISIKLAQYVFLKNLGDKRTPLLLLDDIFDKLDAGRVERIVEYVSQDEFTQIFITDTNRDHLDRILRQVRSQYRLFEVKDGQVCTL